MFIFVRHADPTSGKVDRRSRCRRKTRNRVRRGRKLENLARRKHDTIIPQSDVPYLQQSDIRCDLCPDLDYAGSEVQSRHYRFHRDLLTLTKCFTT